MTASFMLQATVRELGARHQPRSDQLPGPNSLSSSLGTTLSHEDLRVEARRKKC